jgi:hypothetical protein
MLDSALRKIWDKETETISAGSVEALLQKVGDHVQNEKMNSVITPEEANIGRHIDFAG